VERNSTCYLTLSILVGYTFRQPFLDEKMRRREFDNDFKERTSVNTAIEAYELPKFIPTTGGEEETSIGASALPFGRESPAIVEVDALNTTICQEMNGFKFSVPFPTLNLGIDHVRRVPSSSRNSAAAIAQALSFCSP
jgi:hypothetical protein